MVSINFYNENGNVSVKVRDGIRPQILNRVLETLGSSDNFEEVVKNVNGGISIPVAVDAGSGETIYAHFDMTVNTKSPDTKIERKKATKKADTAEDTIPSIF